MPRPRASWTALSLLVSAFSSVAYAAPDVWDGNGLVPPSGNWGAGSNWGDNSTPGTGDSATFNIAQTYNVTVAAAPLAIQDLTVSAGSVTFQASTGPKTLNVNSAIGTGGQDITIAGASTTLTLVNAGVDTLLLNAGDDLSVQSGGTLRVQAGADVAASDLSTAGLNGSIIVDGFGSTLVLGGAGVNNLIGTTGTGSLQIINASITNSIAGNLGIADSATAGAIGTLTIQTNSNLSLAGNLTMANQNVAGQGAILAISGGAAAMTQTGATTTTIGSATSGVATVNIGTTASGGTWTTGTGAISINKTGMVTIGTGANTGIFNANGDVTINGGILQRNNIGSTFTLASGRTLTVQNAGRASFTGGYTTAGGTHTISGATSKLETLTSGDISVNNGISVGVQTGGLISSVGALNVGDSTGGTLSVGGSASAVASLLSTWGTNGGSANVTFSNSSSGSFGSGLNLATSATAGTTALVTVESDADLSMGNLNLATSGGATTSATLDLTGSGTTITQSGASTLTVGHAASGTAELNIGAVFLFGSMFTSGTGDMTIKKTGTLNIIGASSTLNANGNVVIDGGVLTRGTGSTFNLAAGKTLMIQNGGRASFTGNYTTAGGTHTITGNSSKLETLSSGNIDFNGGIAVDVQAGGRIASVSGINIGDSTNGTLTVDGTGGASTADANFASTWGANGGTASVTFSNGATGDFADVNLANDATAGTSAVVYVLSNADLSIDNLKLATSGGASATLNVQGNGSSVTPSGSNSSLTVGHSTSGTATINIGTTTDGGTLTTGMGTTIVKATGTINVGNGDLFSGTLNINGNLTIDGGALHVDSFFSLAAGKTVTIQNGGTATFDHGRGVTSSTWNIVGENSMLDTGDGPLQFIQDGHVNVSFGGSISTNFISLLTNGSSLTIDGVGSSIVSTSNAGASWGTQGAGTFTASNGAIATDNSIIFLGSGFGTGQINVLSGASVTLGGLMMTVGSGPGSANTTVSGAGSALTLNPTGVLSIGNATQGPAVVDILDDGSLTIGTNGTSTINATGVLNIDGGSADLKSLTVNGGMLNFVSGSLSYLGNLTVGTGGLLGFNLILNADRHLTLSGTTTIDAAHYLAINGGTLNTGTLVVNGTFLFNSGTLGITQNGATINTPFVTGNPTTVNINANNVTLGSAASFNGFNHQGTLNVGSNTVTLNSAGYARLGTLTSLVGGTINAANGVAMGTGSNFVGHGTVMSRMAADLGSVIEADGALAVGDAASPIGFVSNGELRTKQFAITLNASSQTTLGTLTALGNGASPGTLNATNGAIVDFGRAITGFGTVNSTNSLAKRTIVNGLAQGNSIAQPLTFSGYVKGVGTFTNVNFTGTFDPGLSPTLLTAGNLAFSNTSLLNIELGGLARGAAYDAIVASGQLVLDGTLLVLLVNSFNPVAGNSFDILDWTTIDGTFDTVTLPPLGSGLAWNTSQLYTTGVLSIATAGIPGDYNNNGTVDAADYVLWRKHNNTGVTLPNDSTPGTSDSDYLVWRSHFGQPPGSGSGATGSTSAPVPEPATGLQVILAMLVASIRRRPRTICAFEPGDIDLPSPSLL